MTTRIQYTLRIYQPAMTDDGETVAIVAEIFQATQRTYPDVLLCATATAAAIPGGSLHIACFTTRG